MTVERVPVEDLAIGETVQAVTHGPHGTVVGVHDGWTIVEYPGDRGPSSLPYRHDEHGTLLRASDPPGPFTADELTLISEAIGGYLDTVEGLIAETTAHALRQLRTRAASLAFMEVSRDA